MLPHAGQRVIFVRVALKLEDGGGESQLTVEALERPKLNLRMGYLLPEKDIPFLQGFGKHHGLLVVNIVVGIAVNEIEKLPQKVFRSPREVRLTIALLILGRHPHEPLRIRRVYTSEKILKKSPKRGRV